MGDVFAGLKVLGFTIAGVGPIIEKNLGDHGACVVRIESRKRPCNLRITGPFKDGIAGLDRSAYYTDLGSNKHSISLDLTNPKGVEIARRLVAWADVVVQNYAPGVVERLGFGYQDLVSIKKDLIVVQASIVGQTGHHSRHPGVGSQVAGLIGFPVLTGWPDTPPLPTQGLPVTDAITPRFGMAALIAALLHRRRTGEGQLIDISQLETSLHFLLPWQLDYQANGRVQRRNGNASPYAAPHDVFRCLGDDQWCAIAVRDDREWQSLCAVLGVPGLAEDARFATLLGRKRHERELNASIQDATKHWEAAVLEQRLLEAGVPAGVVDIDNVTNEPNLARFGYYWWIDHAVMGRYPHPGQPFKLSESPAQPRLPAPCLGEHTELVCRELLGMSDEEFLAAYDVHAFE